MTGFAPGMLGSVAVAVAFASPASAQVVPDLQVKADALIAATWPADGLGGAVIVTQGGKTVYESARGLADIASKTPLTPASVFRIGSITKQFSAAVVMQLVDEGKVSLEDPVSKFVPGYPGPGGGATVRQLLNHTVGVQSYTGIPGWMTPANTARSFTTTEMIAQFRDLPSPFPPGQSWDYNNSGYVLVGAVIEAVTGKPWHVAVTERITRPLGLTTIRYGVEEASIAGMTTPYTRDAQPAQAIHMSVPHAAGALTGSVRDLATWARALHHGKVVKPASYAQMIAPTKLPDGRTIPYGFGLQIGTLRGAATIGHGGGIFGGATDSLYIPEKDLFVAVFVNSDSPATAPGITMRRLAALAMGKPLPTFAKAAFDAATLAPLLGTYVSDDGKVTRRVFAREGKLYAQRAAGPEQEIFAAGEDRFFYGPASLTWFAIRRDAAGKNVMEMHQNGADEIERMTRTDVAATTPS